MLKRVSWRQNKLEFVVRLLFLAVIAVVLLRLGDFGRTAWKSYQDFRRIEGNYEAMRCLEPDYRLALIAGRLIPEGAPYMYASSGPQTLLLMHYAMYPNTNRKWPGGYFIDFAGKHRTPPEGWITAAQAGAPRLLALPGHEFTDAPPIPESYPLGRQQAAFWGLCILELLAGLAILSLLGVSPEDGGSLWYLGGAFLAGFVTLTGLVWAAMMIGLHSTILSLFGIWGIAALLPAAFAFKRLRRNIQLLFARRCLAKNLPSSLPGWALLLAAVCFLCMFILPIVLTPALSHDALSHWLLKAKVLYHERSLVFDETNHNEYPLLWPMNVSMQYILAGGAYDELAKWTLGLLIAALVSQILGACAFLKVPANWAWLLAPLYFVLFFDYSLRWAYAEDCFLALLAGLLAALLAHARNPEKRSYLGLAILMASGLAVTKMEGAAAVVLVAGAFALIQPRFPWSLKAWLLFLALSLPAVLEIGWYFWQQHFGYLGTRQWGEPLTWERAGLLVRSVIDSVQGRGFGWRLFAGAGLVLLLRFGERWTRQELFLALSALALILFTLIALAGWPTEHLREQTLTATPRLLLHSTPAFILLLGSLLCVPRTPDAGAGTQRPALSPRKPPTGKRGPVSAIL